MNILVIAKLSHGNVLWYFSFSLHTDLKLHWKHEPDPPYSFISEDCIHSWDPPKICWHKEMGVCIRKEPKSPGSQCFYSPFGSQGNKPKMTSFKVTSHGWRLWNREIWLTFKLRLLCQRQRGVSGFSTYVRLSTSQHTEQSPQQLSHCTCMCECEMRKP